MKLDDDEAQICEATSSTLANRLYDMSHAVYVGEMRYMYRAPKEVVPFSNVAMPFPGKIWVLLAITLAAFSILFATFHKTYSHLDVGKVTPEPLRANFLIYTFCKITEPEPLPWFHGKAVGGKIGVSSWTLFTLLMLMFYQSNLRAHMITVTYGKPIDTLQDVLGHGRRVWTVNSPTLR